MHTLSTRLGYWSALLAAVTFVLFPLCFIGIMAGGPLFVWTNLADFAAYAQRYGQTFQNLAQFLMLAFGLLYLVMLNSIYESAAPEHKALVRLSLIFGVVFAALTGAQYFVQLSAVRLSLLKGNLDGLTQIVQANPYSAMSSLNMLGWTVFFGLSCLFAAPAFTGGRLERVIRTSLTVNGIAVLSGGVAFVLDLVLLVGILMNMVMGAAVLVAVVALCIWFRRLGSRAEA